MPIYGRLNVKVRGRLDVDQIEFAKYYIENNSREERVKTCRQLPMLSVVKRNV